MTLTGTWEANEYTITFTYGEFSNTTIGGADISDKYLYGAEIELPKLTLSAPGYDFVGYEEIAEGTDKITVTGDATYNAKWELSDEPYTYEIYVKNPNTGEYDDPVVISKTGKYNDHIDTNAERYTDSKYIFEKMEIENANILL